MATEFEIVLKLDNENIVAALGKIADKAEHTAKKSESSFDKWLSGSESAVTKLNSAFGVLQQVIGKALDALQVPAELIKLNDQVVTINKSFGILADQAGVSSTTLKGALEAAAGGVVDLEEVLQVSNKALVELGSNSARLPEVLEIARKAGKAFGVDTLDAFETLNQAIITGQTRQLKSIGIIVDSDAALKEYAKSLGKTTEQLTLAEKQQATLNLVLEEGRESFAGISAASPNLTESLKKLGVAWDDYKETILSSKSAIGGVLIATTNYLSETFAGLAKVNSAAGPLTKENAADKVEVLTAAIARLNTELDIASRQSGPQGMDAKAIQSRIDATYLQLSAASDLLTQTQMQEVANISSVDSENARTAARDAATAASLKAAEAEALLSAEIAKGTNVATAGAMEAVLINESWADSMTTLSAAIDEAARKQKVTYGDLGKMLRDTYVNGFSQAFAAVGAAFAKGENAAESFADSWKRTLGGLAMQLGQFFIATGLGMSATGPLLGLSGGPALAAGIALTVLGGALQASGGSTTDTGTISATGGGITATESATTELTSPEQLERQNPAAQIAVQINGPILGDEAAGRMIVDYINKGFDATGVQIRQGAFA